MNCVKGRRKRLSEGILYIDRFNTIIVRVPTEVYNKIESQGNPSKVAAAVLKEKYKQKAANDINLKSQEQKKKHVDALKELFELK